MRNARHSRKYRGIEIEPCSYEQNGSRWWIRWPLEGRDWVYGESLDGLGTYRTLAEAKAAIDYYRDEQEPYRLMQREAEAEQRRMLADFMSTPDA